MNIETKNFNFELKDSNDKKMEFEGYGSIFGNLDSWRDVVEKGAFARTINNNKSRIKVLWQHDTWCPIGKPIELSEDDKGLFIKARISDTIKGREAYTLMKDKIINEMSIGYNTIKYEYDKDKNIRYLKELKLYEISLVTWGANDKAKVNNVKSFDMLIDEIKSGEILKNASKDKILEAIKSLSALIENNDSPQGTRKLDNSLNEIKNTDSDLFDLVLKKLKEE